MYMHTMNSFSIDKFHEVDENPSSWKLRKRFLQAHWNKFPEDRLVCLSKCFVNVEQDGCRYPDPVMRQLAELRKDLPEIVEEQRENRKRKACTMNFVKASDDQEIGSSSVKNEPPTSSVMTDMGPTSDLFQNNNVSYGFVKSNVEYKSTDISGNGHEGTEITPKRRPAKKSKPTSGIFKVALQDLQTGDQNRQMEEMDVRFLSLGRTVKWLQNPVKNDIEIMYEAASKVHMTVQFNTEYVEDGSCFECVVLVDSVEIARERGQNKKAAKHNAFKTASKKLLMKYLRVVSSTLECSDVPFVKEELPEDHEVLYESNQSQLPKNFKIRHADNLHPLSRFLIMQPINPSTVSSIQILRQSADFNKALLSYSFYPDIGGMKCCIIINGVFVVECLACTKQAAKIKASDMALELLKDQCWTVCLKQAVDTDTEGLSKEEVLGAIDKQSEQIPDSNIGNKLLRKMGWAGGGVGKDGTGIANPVAVEQVINRAGLGLEAQQGIPVDVKAKLESLILNYARSSREDDLVFAPDFTKDERAILHQYSQKLGLVSRSHGKGGSRYLTVRRKRSADQLFDHIMKHGGSTAKYDLFAPGTLLPD